MVNETDEDWEAYKRERDRVIEETDYVIAGVNRFLGIEHSVKSVKDCSINLKQLVDAPKYKILSTEQKKELGEQFIGDAMDSIYSLSGELGSTYVADSDSIHMLKTILNKFRNGNSNDTLYNLLNDSSTEIDCLGKYIYEHRDLNIEQ